MKLELMALCDGANESQGKLNILGAFDHLWVQKTPIVHPMCAITLRMRFQRSEEGEHRVRITFADEDGQPIMPSLDGAIQVKCAPHQSTLLANFIVNVQQLKLEKFGEYTIDLRVDGQHLGSIPLYVKELPPQTPPTSF
ncbi:MAG: hypothetical protein KDK61_05875 [Simkania sp.]|nr:hypothetical protein [Simkania sp.]